MRLHLISCPVITQSFLRHYWQSPSTEPPTPVFPVMIKWKCQNVLTGRVEEMLLWRLRHSSWWDEDQKTLIIGVSVGTFHSKYSLLTSWTPVRGRKIIKTLTVNYMKITTKMKRNHPSTLNSRNSWSRHISLRVTWLLMKALHVHLEFWSYRFWRC
jgi:hypothetical protein